MVRVAYGAWPQQIGGKIHKDKNRHMAYPGVAHKKTAGFPLRWEVSAVFYLLYSGAFR